MSMVDIQVPDIGDFAEVGVIELLVKVGDRGLGNLYARSLDEIRASRPCSSSLEHRLSRKVVQCLEMLV
jgi:hypothetical protein